MKGKGPFTNNGGVIGTAFIHTSKNKESYLIFIKFLNMYIYLSYKDYNYRLKTGPTLEILVQIINVERKRRIFDFITNLIIFK